MDYFETLEQMVDHWDAEHDFEHGKIKDEFNWSMEPFDHLKEVVEHGNLPKGMALDVGSSLGVQSFYLAQKGYKTVGIDISTNAVQHAKETFEDMGPDVRFLVMDFLYNTLPDNEFDLVLDRSCLDHLPMEFQKEYFEQLSRVIKPDGHAIIYYLNGKNKEGPRLEGPGLERFFSSDFSAIEYHDLTARTPVGEALHYGAIVLRRNSV